MTRSPGRFISFMLALPVAGTLALAQQQPPGDRLADQPSEVDLRIGGRIGAQPRFAVPDCLPLTSDRETAEVAATFAQVLWDDLEFEREFRMVARDTYGSIPRARGLTEPPFDAWRELGADGVVTCTVRRTGDDQVEVEARLFNIRSFDSALGERYVGGLGSVRTYAHTFSDEIHRHQRGLRGVARSRLTFVSDRDSQSVLGLVPDRQTKEVYIADYDGANQRRVTVGRSLNVSPAWAPDGRAVAYTSYRSGLPDILVSHIFEGRLEAPAGGSDDAHNFLPAYSPDGRQMAFMSNRDGNPEIYLMNIDRSGLQRLTTHPGIDASPTWSSLGHQIAFTSDRTGSPQIYVVGVDGTGLRRITFESYCDRPTWSPSPYNEIAYASRTGPGFDIRIIDLATNVPRSITFGQGTNESPSYSPNGRHLAFTSTRGSGNKQVWQIGRDGRGLRRVTHLGNNEMANWSR